MIIQADVAQVARQWGLDPALIQAVVSAEGDIVKAVQCSIPSVTMRADALNVLCRSCTHALVDYVWQTAPDGFVAFWRDRWAPLGAPNDPHRLNENWATNVDAIWKADRGLAPAGA